MAPVKLDTKYVEKPWGRTEIPDIFPNPDGRQIGEIWFDGPAGKHPPLLVKYIFTSEKLSVQVHPNDSQAKARGLPGGKSECWYILDAAPDATLGMGTHEALDEAHLRAASLDGSIEKLMDWKTVKAGDFFYIPAGTVHAIGPGLTLIEVQQNNDVTYRLYDYGRPRELHLNDGVEVSKAGPYPDAERNIPLGRQEVLVPDGRAPFELELVSWEAESEHELPAGQSWFIPIKGKGEIDGQAWHGSECWLAENGGTVRAAQATQALIATA